MICLLLSFNIPKPIQASNYDISWNELPSLPGTFTDGAVTAGINIINQEILVVVDDARNSAYIQFWIYNIQIANWTYQEIFRSSEDIFNPYPNIFYLESDPLNSKFYASTFDNTIIEIYRQADGSYNSDFEPLLTINSTDPYPRFVYNHLENQIVLLFTRYSLGLEVKIFDLDASSWVEIEEPIIDYLAESEWNSFVFNPTNYEIMYKPINYRDRRPENFTLSFDLTSKKWIKREYSQYPSDTTFISYLYNSGIKKYIGMGGKIISSGLETKDIWIYDPNLNEWDNDDRLPEKFSRAGQNMVYNPVDGKIYAFSGWKENKRLFRSEEHTSELQSH